MGSKSNPSQLTIQRLWNTHFDGLYSKLAVGDELSSDEIVKLLSIAIILVNQDEKTLNQLGYRIALFYANLYHDYVPLYDIALNTGLIPVANLAKKLIEQEEIPSATAVSPLVNELAESFVEVFRDGDILRTEEQLILSNFYKENLDSSLYVVAPTSYGKSELIIETVEDNPRASICILVPSKSLLSQTKKRLLDARIDWVKKYVTHPDMHDEKLQNSVHLLTQERLSRLLSQDKDLSFDFLLVDEAHNLLTNDSRNHLLASVISVLGHRNDDLAIKYLTPFLKDTSNLQLKTAKKVELEYLVDEYVKSERFLLADFRDGVGTVEYYDHFLDDFLEMEADTHDAIEYLNRNSTNKNIVYFNRPKDIEKFVLELIKSLDPVEDEDINTAILELSASVDEEYTLINCLSRGVVYHHGSMTDSVRHYVEYLFRNSDSLKYLVSSSTLLEGVNLPIERLFLMSQKKGLGNLSPSQFHNLVGRVNRFSEVFSDVLPENLKLLEPEVHLIGTDDYTNKRANLHNFLKKSSNVSRKIKDGPENILLESVSVDDSDDEYIDTISRLENLEGGIIEDFEGSYCGTEVGQLLIASGVDEIHVFEKEEEISNQLEQIDAAISDPNTLLRVIADAFITHIDVSDKKHHLNRLMTEQAQSFYSMLFEWQLERIPFKLMIARFIDYWDKKSEEDSAVQIYVGKLFLSQ